MAEINPLRRSSALFSFYMRSRKKPLAGMPEASLEINFGREFLLCCRRY